MDEEEISALQEKLSMKTDVLVAGAGPVGLTMASELGRYGLSVRLIDKHRTHRQIQGGRCLGAHARIDGPDGRGLHPALHRGRLQSQGG
jgi:ribulose 1,5-bisphosphate synthetase/thiazole synthase